eukprot:scaffold85587_cov42-Phaeocystis_antarctica.AAC.4
MTAAFGSAFSCPRCGISWPRCEASPTCWRNRATAERHRPAARRRPELLEEDEVVALWRVVLQAVVLRQESDQLGRRPVVSQRRRVGALVRQHVAEERRADAAALAALVHVEVEDAERRDLAVLGVGLAPHEELLGPHLEQASHSATCADREVEAEVAGAHAAEARDRLAQPLRHHRALAHRVQNVPNGVHVVGRAIKRRQRGASEQQEARARHAAGQRQLFRNVWHGEAAAGSVGAAMEVAARAAASGEQEVASALRLKPNALRWFLTTPSPAANPRRHEPHLITSLIRIQLRKN